MRGRDAPSHGAGQATRYNGRMTFPVRAITLDLDDTLWPFAPIGVRIERTLDAFLREHVESAYHPCGTCRMGRRDDPLAVVDAECRVIGVEGLRVADSSIFPQVTNGNLNGPSIMTGEKAADHVLGRKLARSNLEPVINPNWRTSQR